MFEANAQQLLEAGTLQMGWSRAVGNMTHDGSKRFHFSRLAHQLFSPEVQLFARDEDTAIVAKQWAGLVQ